ncbi:MAG TPA: pyruvate, phosphate dikinase, partial [Opitutaceae bacterium]|nr:pyruvate, phosphate dikinase [Opitutaceae bacterium]
MPKHTAAFSTGLPGLDKVLHGIEPGDNVVWEVDDIEEYGELIVPYVQAAKADGRRLIYFRFAPHAALVPESAGAELHHVDPASGFENFVRDVHAVIERAGRGAVYVFDC